MPKISYLLSALVLVGGLAVQPVMAKNGNYSDNKKQNATQSSHSGGKVHWNSGRSSHGNAKASKKANHGSKSIKKNNGHKYKWHGSNQNKHSAHKGQKNRVIYKSGHQNKGKSHYRNKSYYKGKHYYKSKPRVYYPRSKARYYKPYYKPYYKGRYYKPRYVYLKPYPRYRYYGYYPYRGYSWPFVNVNFVMNLSDRQMERHHQAVYTALDAPVGEVATWYDRGRHGTIVVLREGVDSSGNICKQYKQTISYKGRVSTETVVSCLSPDGYWVTP